MTKYIERQVVRCRRRYRVIYNHPADDLPRIDLRVPADWRRNRGAHWRKVPWRSATYLAVVAQAKGEGGQ